VVRSYFGIVFFAKPKNLHKDLIQTSLYKGFLHIFQVMKIISIPHDSNGENPAIKPTLESYTSLCSSSLNSTAVLFVFIGNIYKNGGQFATKVVTKVAIFNFQSKVWIDIPKMKEELQDAYMTCAMVILFGKQTSPKAVVVFNGIYEYNSIFQNE
jgi:hypothetical protein